MSDLVKLLNESKNGYLSMCIRLLNLFEAEKGGGVTVWSSLGYSVGFFFHFRMWHPTQNLQLLLKRQLSLLLSIYKLKITDSI